MNKVPVVTSQNGALGLFIKTFDNSFNDQNNKFYDEKIKKEFSLPIINYYSGIKN